MRRLVTQSAAIGALALVLVLLGGPVTEAHAGGGCRSRASSEASGDAVRMDEGCFVPTVLRVETGTEVTFANKSEVSHTVSGATLEWGSYDPLGNGDAVTYNFDKPGTYPFFCLLHPGMIGAVVVGDGKSTAAQLPPSRVIQTSAVIVPTATALQITSATTASSPSNGDSNGLLIGGISAAAGAIIATAGFGVRALRNA
ncbi:MAG: cupredoxin domain-containing protein [bacterium]